jgi:hypothetical protein
VDNFEPSVPPFPDLTKKDVDFIRPHFTTKQVPAVALGILDKGLSLFELFNVRLI